MSEMTIVCTPPHSVHEAVGGGIVENRLESADAPAANVRKDEPCAQYRPDGFLNMSAARLKDLGWRAEVPLDEMFRRMASAMKKERKE